MSNYLDNINDELANNPDTTLTTTDELYRTTANIAQIIEHLQVITRHISSGTRALPAAATGLRTDQMDGQPDADVTKAEALKALSESTHALQVAEASAHRAHNYLARLYIQEPDQRTQDGDQFVGAGPTQ